jgi:hypothetical protein
MQIEITNSDIVIDAAILAESFDLSVADFRKLMQDNAITSVCEKGVDVHAGEYRLSFFSRNRRVRLNVDECGRILRRSVIDFGERPLAGSVHSAKG